MPMETESITINTKKINEILPALLDHLIQGAGIAIGIKATEALLGK